MDEFDDPTEEEEKLAAEFARDHDSNLEDEPWQLRSLRETVTLLENSERWELDSAARQRGLEEIQKWTATSPTQERKTDRRKVRWLFWLPLPSLAVLALALWLAPDSRNSAFFDSTAPQRSELAEVSLREAPEQHAAKELAEAPASAPGADAAPRDTEEGFEKVPPRYHAGQISPRLLKAQAAVLSERAPGKAKDEAKQAFEREMRAYRGQLIASLEVGGR